MPQEAEDLAEDMIFRILDEQEWLLTLQKKALLAAEKIQDLRKAQLNAYGPTAVRLRMRQLNRDTLSYYRNDFDKIYLAGARSVDPTFTIGEVERRKLALMNTDEYLKLRSAADFTVRDSKRFIEMVWNDRGDRRKKLGIKTMRVNVANPMKMTGVTTEKVSGDTIRMRGIKSVIYRDGKRYDIGNYGQMVIRSGANRAYNAGILDALSKKGFEWVAVSDGPECGWTYHDDPEAANGMIVTMDEARANPSAHPNCKRTFAPATPKQIKDEERRRGEREGIRKAEKERSTAEKTALASLAVLGGGFAALEATNLLAAGAERFIASDAFDNLIQRLAVQAFHGDKISRWFVRQLSFVQQEFRPSNVLASVSQIYPGGPINVPSLPLFDNVRYFADGLMGWTGDVTGANKIPGYIKAAVGAADDALEDQLTGRFQAFYHAAKRAAMSEDFGSNLRNVIDMEAKRRGAFFHRLTNLPSMPEIRASWSRWGPRARVDITDWIRAKTTFTPTGAINTLAVNAAGQIRGVVKIYQDGLIGAHISAIPRNFLNGVIRGIVEIDEQGHLVGNIRLVPGGPLRLRLEFKSLGVEDIEKFSPEEYVKDLRARKIYDTVHDDFKTMDLSVDDIRSQLLGESTEGIAPLKLSQNPEALRYALNNGPISSTPLYRGMGVPKALADDWQIGSEVKPKAIMSFSSDLRVAGDFSKRTYGDMQNVVLFLEGDHTAIEKRLLGSGILDEQEWLMSHPLTVVNRENKIDNFGNEVLKLTVRQTEVPTDRNVVKYLERAKLNLRDAAISPLGTIGNIADQFRAFKFDRAVFELRIFNQSVFDISTNLRISVSDARAAIKEALQNDTVQEILSGDGSAIQRYTGVVKHFVQNPDFVKKIYADSKGSLFGNIRFTSLTEEAKAASPVLRTLSNFNVRILNRAHLADGKLQDVVTNMRIHGWNIYDVANVLKVRVEDVKVLAQNGIARLQATMETWGITRPEDLLPVWDGRMAMAQDIVQRSPLFKGRGTRPNVAETIIEALHPIYTGASPTTTNLYNARALITLIDAKPGDQTQRLYLKLRTTLNFIRSQEWVEGNYVASYSDGITDDMLRATAAELSGRVNSLLHLV